MKKMNLQLDKTWTLFLDRDGVINERIPEGYVMDFAEFKPVENLIPALKILSNQFEKIYIVTNQQCIGKNLCTYDAVLKLHHDINDFLLQNHILIADFFVCPHKATDHCTCRKPKPGLALQAQKKYPSIDFAKSIMVGDMISDIQFGKNLGMVTVYVGDRNNRDMKEIALLSDYRFQNIYEFAETFQ